MNDGAGESSLWNNRLKDGKSKSRARIQSHVVWLKGRFSYHRL